MLYYILYKYYTGCYIIHYMIYYIFINKCISTKYTLDHFTSNKEKKQEFKNGSNEISSSIGI